MTELELYSDVVDRVRLGMAGVQYLRPAPKRPRRRLSIRSSALIAGVAAIVLIATLVLAPSRTRLVWAAVPEVVTEQDVQAATVACQESLDAHDPSLDIRVGELPPLVVLDLRGNRAVAIFRGGGEYVVCLVDTAGDSWEGSIFSAVPYGTEETGSLPLMENANVIDSGTWGEGDDMVTLVTGAVPRSVARVVFEFTVPDLGSAEATVAEGALSIWWPGGSHFDVDIRTFRADGSELHLPVVGISAGEASPRRETESGR
ncbi:MAG: hypothetical protein ACRDGU_06020 [Actinomycetota bacterium]